jgi:hypothetical protein
MCGIENHLKKRTKAQPVAMQCCKQHKGLLKRQPPGRMDRRKQGGNRGDSGRFPQIFLKNTIDKNPSLE